MPRPSCEEDLFECHIRRIFRRLFKENADDIKGDPAGWLWENRAEVGMVFLEDVEQWMGLEKAIERAKGE